jgi:hypothetical protein
MDVTIGTHELSGVWPKLDERTKQAIYIAVLERRIEEANAANLALGHQVEVLEEAVKMPEGYARTNHSTVHEDEFIDGVLPVRQPNPGAAGVTVA